MKRNRYDQENEPPEPQRKRSRVDMFMPLSSLPSLRIPPVLKESPKEAFTQRIAIERLAGGCVLYRLPQIAT